MEYMIFQHCGSPPNSSEAFGFLVLATLGQLIANMRFRNQRSLHPNLSFAQTSHICNMLSEMPAVASRGG